MTNNDILRRLRYAFNYTNVHVAKLMGHVGEKVELSQVGLWIQREDGEPLSDKALCQFLDGLIIEKRGPRPDGAIPHPQATITRNEILKKLRIALSLRDEGMMGVFKNAKFVVTKAELGSFFRKEGQRNYAECPEQVLRKFIHSLGQEEQEAS
ncbi:MAG: DUF1456 family protein [Akkermansiaceae bacterium]